MAKRHLIGLLLATEVDWPAAFEAVINRVGSVRWSGETHEFGSERIRNEPFDLRYRPQYSVVIDRLSWWYDLPRDACRGGAGTPGGDDRALAFVGRRLGGEREKLSGR